MCSSHFLAGLKCVGLCTLDRLGATSDKNTMLLIMVATEPVSSSFAGQVLGLVDSGVSFNFMSCALCTNLGWRVDKQQQDLVWLANGTVVKSKGQATGILQEGPLRGLISV